MVKFTSLLLSFLLLASHSYLTIGTHFCGGEQVETKIIFGKTHLGCNMPDREGSCNIPAKNDDNKVHFDQIPCCENEFQTVQTTNEFLKEGMQHYFNVDFAVAFIYNILKVDLSSRTNHQLFTAYSSPPIEKEVQILLQTFLI